MGILKFFPPPALLTMPAAGIDISDSSIKFLALKKTEYGKEPAFYGEKNIPPGAVSGGEIKDVALLAKTLSEIQKERNVEFIRASLPEERVFMFQTKIHKGLSDQETRDLIELKLEESVPLSAGEAVFDYDLPMETESEAHRSRQQNVSVAVYPLATVKQYTDAFREANLTLLSLEVEAQAIARAVIQEGDDGTYMIVDFGKMRTGLAIVSRGLLSFTSTLDVVGDTLTEAVAEHFSVSIEEAERIKNESNFIQNKDNSELFNTLMETITSLKNEIARHFRYWNSRTDESGGAVPRIEKIILCGGSSNVVGLREFLSGSLRTPSERANVWTNAFSFDDVIPGIDYAHSLGYATAVGLAMRTEV